MEVQEDHILLVQVQAAPSTVWNCKIGDDVFAHVVLRAMKEMEVRGMAWMELQRDTSPFEVFALDEFGRRARTGTRLADRPLVMAELVQMARQLHRKGRFIQVLGPPA